MACMTRYAVVNTKSGIGKTTVACHLNREEVAGQ
jgi:cellulose biosynthesis protein BcsQ